MVVNDELTIFTEKNSFMNFAKEKQPYGHLQMQRLDKQCHSEKSSATYEASKTPQKQACKMQVQITVLIQKALVLCNRYCPTSLKNGQRNSSI